MGIDPVSRTIKLEKPAALMMSPIIVDDYRLVPLPNNRVERASYRVEKNGNVVLEASSMVCQRNGEIVQSVVLTDSSTVPWTWKVTTHEETWSGQTGRYGGTEWSVRDEEGSLSTKLLIGPDEPVAASTQCGFEEGRVWLRPGQPEGTEAPMVTAAALNYTLSCWIKQPHKTQTENISQLRAAARTLPECY